MCSFTLRMAMNVAAKTDVSDVTSGGPISSHYRRDRLSYLNYVLCQKIIK
jgi:hypothetical protein